MCGNYTYETGGRNNIRRNQEDTFVKGIKSEVSHFFSLPYYINT